MELTEGSIQLRIDIVGNGSPLTEDTHLHKEGPMEKLGIADDVRLRQTLFDRLLQAHDPEPKWGHPSVYQTVP